MRGDRPQMNSTNSSFFEFSFLILESAASTAMVSTIAFILDSGRYLYCGSLYIIILSLIPSQLSLLEGASSGLAGISFIRRCVVRNGPLKAMVILVSDETLRELSAVPLLVNGWVGSVFSERVLDIKSLSSSGLVSAGVRSSD